LLARLSSDTQYLQCPQAQIPKGKAILSEDVPATVACEVSHKLNTMELGIPAEAYPTRETNGEHSYTRDGPLGIKIEVHYGRPVTQYFLKAVARGTATPASRSVNWKKHGGPAAAWEMAKELTGWPK